MNPSLSSSQYEAVKLALKEQHQNTRHDAIEKILEITARWSVTHNLSVADNMLNEITGAILNLKQREPNFNSKQETHDSK